MTLVNSLIEFELNRVDSIRIPEYQKGYKNNWGYGVISWYYIRLK